MSSIYTDHEFIFGFPTFYSTKVWSNQDVSKTSVASSLRQKAAIKKPYTRRIVDMFRYSFQKMRAAYADYGHEMSITFYTDHVKGDQAFDGPLKDVKPTIVDEMNGTGSNSCNHLQLPKDVDPTFIATLI
ncbi:hypothetical protein INT47_007073 [Mucor saturninus]|uniref:Uncharacterized protein n=1 Tax=Mucor saturninus TaxID=64648 RepID=A0A8H7R421_9FUNG|nr:hypothetical protein INT47_007073 [Mucor saturninus]